jgi:Ca2+-binding RTX toxin-like protein
LVGGAGEDTYFWLVCPRANATVVADEGKDSKEIVKIYFTLSTEVRLSRAGENGDDLVITNSVFPEDSGASLTIKGYFSPTCSIETIEFAGDNILWRMRDVLEILDQQPPPRIDEGKVIIGTAFADTIDGGVGDDALFGGKGNDVYISGGAKGSDLIEDAGGVDTVQIEAASSSVKLLMHLDGTLVISLGDRALMIKNYFATSENGGHIEKLAFSDGTIWNVDNVLEILSSPKPDPVAEPEPVPNQEGEIIVGRKGNDILLGTLDDDTLMGGLGHDTLNGRAGNDILVGGQGKDKLTGGMGEDFFLFTKKADLGLGSDRDSIDDFEIGIDLIDLSRIDANASTKKHDMFKTLLKGKAAFTKAGQLHYDAKTGVLSGNTDKDAEAEFQILFKNKPKALHIENFIL